jgi:hypothetical protein
MRPFLDPPILTSALNFSAVTDGQAVPSPDIPRVRNGYLYRDSNGIIVAVLSDGSGGLRYRLWSDAEGNPFSPTQTTALENLADDAIAGGSLISPEQIAAIAAAVTTVASTVVSSNPGAHSVTLDIQAINGLNTTLPAAITLMVAGDATTGNPGVVVVSGFNVQPLPTTPGSPPADGPHSGTYTTGATNNALRITVQGAAAGSVSLFASAGAPFTTRTVTIP